MSEGRKRKPTEKGKQYQLGLLKDERRSLEKTIRKEILELERMDRSDENKTVLEERFNNLNVVFEDFMAVHGQCQLLNDDADRKLDDCEVDMVDRKMYELRRLMTTWLNGERERSSIIRKSSRVSSKKSEGSRQGSSSNSMASTRSSRSIQLKVKEERARIAELQIEAAFLKQQQQQELEKRELQLKLEMAKSSAKLKIFEEEPELVSNASEKTKYVQDYIRQIQRQDKDEISKQMLRDSERKENEKVNESNQVETKEHKEKTVFVSQVDQLADIVARLQAPDIELDMFDGNPLEFLFFITTFAEAVETKVRDQRGRLTRLLKYLTGEPKDLVSSCVYLPSSSCYDDAKRILTDRYGDPYKIMSAYRKEIKAWPRLKVNDSASFSKFHTFLVKFKCTLKYSGNNWYDSPDLIQLLHSKLPTYVQDRWNRQALKVRRSTGGEAKLNDFMQLLQEEVDLVSDPLYSREANQEQSSGQDKERYTKRSRKVFETRTPKTCPLCSLKHDLDECVTYLKKPVEERRRFIFKSRLCFCCYEPSSTNHTAKTCPRRRVCDICKNEHPTGLHGYTRKNPGDNQKQSDAEIPSTVKTSCTKMEASIISLCVVPVKIYCKSKHIITHALLDNGSQGSFVKESIMDELNADGVSTTVTIKTLSGETTSQCKIVRGLRVSSSRENHPTINLPPCYSQAELHVEADEVPTPGKVQRWRYLNDIKKYLPQDGGNIEIGILIGGNCPLALEPNEVIPSKDGGPYAYRTKLGWCIMGPITGKALASTACNKIAVKNVADQQVASHYFCIASQVQDQTITNQLMRMYQHDFNEVGDSSILNSVSQEDMKFLEIMNEQVVKVDGHYQLPLPFRNPDVKFANNKSQVIQRMLWLKRKLKSNPKMLKHYNEFMEKLLIKDYARPTPIDELSPPAGKSWYIPHFGVYHPKKPDSIRVVFDCSATYAGMGLNKELLQGPDLTNKLVGVLNRFRWNEIAVMADIEAMFYQVLVPPDQYTFLRFLWWPNGNLEKDLQEYQMKVHLFGAVSSPSCSNFALRKTADDNKDEFGDDICDVLLNNFYVDDKLKSHTTVPEAIEKSLKVKDLCSRGGFNLTKYVSNSREVLESIDKKDHGKSVKDLDLSVDLLPAERALGVLWCIENDSFGFRIQLKDSPLSRRGILSTISSIYDPLGFASPFLLQGRRILQQLCGDKKNWDEEITPDERSAWERWRGELPGLESLNIPRCFKPKNFGSVVKMSIHHFSDASDVGYGEASYLRLENSNGQVNCSLLMGKSRVAPLKPTTIPRLELTAATVAVKVGTLLKTELELRNVDEFYWTDSTVVLGYLKNESRRFHLFVTNRIRMILDHSTKSQWRYVETKMNPADDASRGINITRYLKNRRWFEGPVFLQQPLHLLTKLNTTKFTIDDQDPEVKSIKVNKISLHDNILSRLTSRTTKWLKLKRIVATMMQWRNRRRDIEIENLRMAELTILKLVQQEAFSEEIDILQKQGGAEMSQTVKKVSPLHNLNPFLDNEGILRVGGRLSRDETEEFNIIHPVILPKKSDVTWMIVRQCHEKVQHGGRGFTINEVRRSGYWVINCNAFVRHLIWKCVTCKLLRGKTSGQMMADLPQDRLEATPPFTICGVDYFGPFVIKEGRKEIKRYGALFTCFHSRAVHIEASNTLDTDSFIQALRRFISRRGNVRTIRCDNGTNFVGAERELRRALNEMDDERISSFLQLHGGDWIGWRRNPPASSHFGGVWERQIRTVRTILSSLLRTHGKSLNDENFRTLLVEVEGIVNSRPLTTETLSDVDSQLPLSPVNLLTMKSSVIAPPPGSFEDADIYSRRRWRRIQHIANEFWIRWKKEYLQNLQKRAKWQGVQRCFRVGDVVVLKEISEYRCDWKLAKVEEAFADDKGLVRTVRLRTSNGHELIRPVHKLVLLVES